MNLFILLLFLCSPLMYRSEVAGTNWNLSKQENLKIERQLKLMTKPAIKTVQGCNQILLNVDLTNKQTENGDLYDCVDFFRQPAFDHPLLKKCTSDYQVIPPSIVDIIENQSSKKIIEVDNIGFKKLECPIGTVPLKRVTREDLVKEYLASKASGQENDQLHFAGVQTTGTNKYSGAGAFISIHHLPTIISGQYSAARIRVTNGPEAIQAGWRVDPDLYDDTKTRFFIRTDAGDTHCFNTLCPGFVLVRTDFPLTGVIQDHPIPGTNPLDMKVFIIRDEHKNWNLKVADVIVGYWPSTLFTGLSGLASLIDWGGEVYSLTGKPSPPMATGESHLREDTKKDGFFKQVSSYNEKGQITDAPHLITVKDSDHYYVKDEGYFVTEYKHLVFYGGAGTK